jgi:hypothetical protein
VKFLPGLADSCSLHEHREARQPSVKAVCAGHGVPSSGIANSLEMSRLCGESEIVHVIEPLTILDARAGISLQGHYLLQYDRPAAHLSNHHRDVSDLPESGRGGGVSWFTVTLIDFFL